MIIEIDDKLQREILSLRRKILSDSPFSYMKHISGDCVNMVRKLGKMITDKGITIKEECIYCPNMDCDCSNCIYKSKKK